MGCLARYQQNLSRLTLARSSVPSTSFGTVRACTPPSVLIPPASVLARMGTGVRAVRRGIRLSSSSTQFGQPCSQIWMCEPSPSMHSESRPTTREACAYIEIRRVKKSACVHAHTQSCVLVYRTRSMHKHIQTRALLCSKYAYA